MVSGCPRPSGGLLYIGAECELAVEEDAEPPGSSVRSYNGNARVYRGIAFCRGSPAVEVLELRLLSLEGDPVFSALVEGLIEGALQGEAVAVGVRARREDAPVVGVSEPSASLI